MPASLPPKPRSTLLLGAAFALSFVIALFAITVGSYVSKTEWVDHALNVDRTADEWLAALLEAETAVRGYVIAGTPDFLEPYQASIQRERLKAAQVRALVADNPEQLRNVEIADGYARDALEGLKETVALVRAGHRDEAIVRFRAGAGSHDIRQFRDANTRIESSESALLVERRAQARTRAELSLATVVVITLVSYALLAYAWRLQRTRADLLHTLARDARQRLETLSKLAMALSGARSRSQVADIIVDQGMSAAGADTCTLYMVDDSGAELQLIGDRGVSQDVIGHVRRLTERDGRQSVFDSWKENRTVWAESEAEYTALYPALSGMKARGPRAKAFWSIPLVAEGHPVGLLGMGFYAARKFSADERAFVTTIAHQCAQALLRASRFEREDEARTWFTTTLRSIGDAVIATDADGNVTFMNPIAERLTGYTERDAIGRSLDEVFDIVSEETHAKVEGPVARVLREGTVVGLSNHTLLRSKSGVEIPIDDSGAPIRNEAGRLFGVVLVFRDSSQARATRVRREFLARAGMALVSSIDYESVLQTVAQLAVPALADFCYVDLLKPGADMPEQVAAAHVDSEKARIARELRARYPRQPTEERGILAVVRTGRAQLHEEIPEASLTASARDPDHLRLLKELRLESAMIVPLRGHDRVFGAMTFVYASPGRHYRREDLEFAEDFAHRAAMAIENALSMHELREARAHERLLRGEAEIASRAKDEFLAMVSHELRTPLTAILGWAVMLRERGVDGDVARGLAVIERNARAQTKLIEDVLDVSRIISGKLALTLVPTDIPSVIGAAVETVTPAAQAKDVTIGVDVGPCTTTLVADADRLQQVVWNLLANAVKFTPKGGRVTVRTYEADAEFVVSVADTGEGIRPDALPYVFEPFRQADSSTTRRHGGLGLGLAIVKQLVQAHGGTVDVESEGHGKGATFTVRLPKRAALPALARLPRGSISLEPAVLSGQPPRLDGLRVLVVDDERDALDLVAGVLSEHGADVECSTSASDALDALERRTPDVIVSDIGMPQVDGYSLIRQIRALPAARGGRTPALALTAYARAEDAERAFSAGYQMHVTKPIEPAHLVSVVANLGGRTLAP